MLDRPICSIYSTTHSHSPETSPLLRVGHHFLQVSKSYCSSSTLFGFSGVFVRMLKAVVHESVPLMINPPLSIFVSCTTPHPDATPSRPSPIQTLSSIQIQLLLAHIDQILQFLQHIIRFLPLQAQQVPRLVHIMMRPKLLVW